MEQPQPLIDNIEARIILARDVQEAIRRNGAAFNEQQRESLGLRDPGSFQLTMMQLSVFLYMDIGALRELRNKLNNLKLLTAAEIASGLAAIESFLVICKPDQCPGRSESLLTLRF